MGQNYIEVQSLTLRELFSGNYVFELPWFQRAYAWQTEQVSGLLDDLFSALEVDGNAAEYFLGTLLICKPENSTATSLIDGHQRTMTLTILFSVLRDLCDNAAERAELGRFVYSTDYHLRPQDAQAKFCSDFVQKDGATIEQPDELFEALSFTERNIITNRDFIRERLSASEISQEQRRQLSVFLGDRCHVIVHRAPNDEEAWARLRKEEETRLDFSSVNLAKDSILSVVPVAEREQCAKIWEQSEELVGGDDLYGLLCHLRSLKNRKTRSKPLEEEIAEAFKLNKNGLGFMQQVLLPAASHVRALRTGTVGPTADRSRIADLCSYMSWIDGQSWLPPALVWLGRHGSNHPETKSFFAKLERLFWIVNMAPDGTEKLQPRLLKVVDQVEKGTAVDDIEALKIERKLKLKALEKLRAQYFDRRALRAEVMRRVAVVDGEDPGPIDGEKVTMEHILPRGWKLQNQWRVAFPDRASVVAHAHRLGNLTYLTRKDNSDADSKEFETKKAVYAQSNFKMTRALASQKTWLQSDIESRSEQLIAQLFSDWDLSVS